MNESISIMIVEDNAEYRNALELTLRNQPEFKLTSKFQTAEIAVRSLAESKQHPDVILLDLRLPGMGGISAIPELLTHSPNSKIVVLTQSDKEPDVLDAVSAGALGYLLKSASASELINAVRVVARGDATIDSKVAKFVFNSLQSDTQPQGKSILSERELEVLALLAKGFVKKEIANKLGIGYTTVDTHVSRIYGKLKVNNAPAAVNRAHLLNLLPDSEHCE